MDLLLCLFSRFVNVCVTELGSLMLLQSWPEGARRKLALPIDVVCSSSFVDFAV